MPDNRGLWTWNHPHAGNVYHEASDTWVYLPGARCWEPDPEGRRYDAQKGIRFCGAPAQVYPKGFGSTRCAAHAPRPLPPQGTGGKQSDNTIRTEKFKQQP